MGRVYTIGRDKGLYSNRRLRCEMVQKKDRTQHNTGHKYKGKIENEGLKEIKQNEIAQNSIKEGE